MYLELLLSQRHLLLGELHLTEKRRRHLLLIPMTRLQTRRRAFPFAKSWKNLCCRVSDFCKNKFEQTHFCNQWPVIWEVTGMKKTSSPWRPWNWRTVPWFMWKSYIGVGAHSTTAAGRKFWNLYGNRGKTWSAAVIFPSCFFLFLRGLWATDELHKETHDLSDVTHGWLTVDLLALIRRDFSSAAGWRMSRRIKAEKQASFRGRIQGQSLTLCVLNWGNGW